MKNKILLVLFILISIFTKAQSLNENFESYSAGDYMGLAWSGDFTTKSGTVGGEEDVQVSDVFASSGTKSIHFLKAGFLEGPQDVIIPFEEIYSTGTYVFESMFYVVAGKGANFKFLAETLPDDLIAINCQMVQDGRLIIDGGGSSSVLLETTYPSETWFKLTISVNLNTNDWELLIDDVSQGFFVNAVNQIASIEIQPQNYSHGGNNISEYYMDDIEYLHASSFVYAINLAPIEIINTNGLEGSIIHPTVKIRNIGTSTITSFDISLTYNGTTISETISGISMETLEFSEIYFSDDLTLASGEHDITATISNINGAGIDVIVADAEKTQSIITITPAFGKRVLAEEATGTWCSWCVRGIVFFERATNNYPDYFIGVAVHNDDPMAISSYNAGIAPLISGYPSVLVNRNESINPSNLDEAFLEQVIIPPKGILTISSDYTDGATTVSVTVDVQLVDDLSSDYRVGLIIAENGVTGTGSDYDQHNAYAGGGAGEMGGFELLANPIPASDMVYDHVARAILPNFIGIDGVFPEDATIGETYSHSFEVEIEEDWNLDEIHFIGFLRSPDALIDNAGSATVAESVANASITIKENDFLKNKIDIFPNPTHTQSIIKLKDIENEKVSITLFDMSGKIITKKDYGVLNGSSYLPIEVQKLEKGIYNVQIVIGGSSEIKKLVVN